MCPYINEGMNIDGPYYYCAAAAFGLSLTAKELEDIGCTEAQRKTCQALMEITLGSASLPEPVEKNPSVIIGFNLGGRKFRRNTVKVAQNYQEDNQDDRLKVQI